MIVRNGLGGGSEGQRKGIRFWREEMSGFCIQPELELFN